MSGIRKLLGFQLFDFNRNRHNRTAFKWHYGIISFLLWIVIFPFLILQFFGLFLLINQFGTKKRKLSLNEIRELELVFASSVDYSRIRIRENSFMAKLGARHINSAHLGFVFLNTVHFSRTIKTENNVNEMAWLVHEVTHISQYQKLGIVYMIKALRAQRNGGYRYESSWLNSEIKDFNFEQQADISKVYYLKLKEGKPCVVFTKVLEQIRSQSFC